ncbi:MAG: GNAT family N-acetyltransferase [Promethearchaeota archaeon]|jgi:GNAT superfamily N-acetyltransferase
MTENYQIEVLNEENYIPAFDKFFTSMEFNDEDTKNHLINGVNLFYRNNRFISVGIKEATTQNYVGFGSFITLDDRAWIPYFGIDPKYQRKGLGKKLMNKLIAIAGENNWETIELCATKAGYPLYKAAKFTADYPVNMYKIKEVKEESNSDLQIFTSIPEWVYQLDREVVDEDRKDIFHIHNYENLKIIAKKDKGFGALYGTRVGPIIADSVDLAKEIILTAHKLGAESFLLVEDTKIKSAIKEAFELESVQIMQVTKMTYGKPVNQKLQKIFGLRSFAYG